MIDITKDIQPLTTLRNHSVEFMQQLKTTQHPIILTVNGKPVIQQRRSIGTYATSSTETNRISTV